MRYLVYGAGAVGGTVGGRLSQHGHDVVLVARGPHRVALADRGLTLRDPDESVTLPIPVVAEPSGHEFRDDDVVVLAMKTQDVEAALRSLALAAPAAVPVVCAMNGVEAERLALRRFERVYGVCVMLPATHIEPGVVLAHSAPITGILDVGRYPTGADDLAEQIAADLRGATFASEALPAVMRSKYAKLLMNLGNALEAACGPIGRESELYSLARAEGAACLAAAGIDVASEEEDRARRGDLMHIRPIAGERRQGGSSWQSLVRGTGSIEADHLNGEIVLLGRLHGVPTPVNALLQRTANRLAHDGEPPGSVDPRDLLAALDRDGSSSGAR